MSGGRARTALEETGARLGDVLRRALRDRLARRIDGFSRSAGDRQEVYERGVPALPMADRTQQVVAQRDRGEFT